jgi:hypothetical protein
MNNLNTNKALGLVVVGLLALGMLPTASAAFAAGSIVGAADNDTTYALAATGHTVTCYLDSDGDGVADTNEPIYLQVAACGVGSIAAGDLRLAAGGGGAAGTIVKGSDTDFARNTLAVATSYCFFDADGDGVYSLGDPVYVDLAAACAAVTVGDIALSNYARVTGSSANINGPLVGIGVAIAAETFFDADGDAAYSTADTVYLDVDASANPTVNDVRLTMLGSETAGSIVGDADVDTTFALAATGHTVTCYIDSEGDGVADTKEHI